jgi:hypothetical protein
VISGYVNAVRYALCVLQETYFAVRYEWTCDTTDDMRKTKMLKVMHESEFVHMQAESRDCNTSRTIFLLLGT